MTTDNTKLSLLKQSVWLVYWCKQLLIDCKRITLPTKRFPFDSRMCEGIQKQVFEYDIRMFYDDKKLPQMIIIPQSQQVRRWTLILKELWHEIQHISGQVWKIKIRKEWK